MTPLTLVRPRPTESLPPPPTPGLAERIASTAVRGKHNEIGKALSAAHGDALQFQLALVEAADVQRSGRILDPQGSVISTAPEEWLRERIAVPGRTWAVIREDLLSQNLIRTNEVMAPMHFVARYGSAPQDFVQAVVRLVTEYPSESLLPSTWHWMEPGEGSAWVQADQNKPALGAPYYRFDMVENVAAFIERSAAIYRDEFNERMPRAAQTRVLTMYVDTGEREERLAGSFPDFPRTPGLSPLQRFFSDWAESSAGIGGHRIEDHWVLQMSEGEFRGKKYCGAIPRWTHGNKLPQARKAKLRTVPGLVEWLERFDDKAGHPFAWYFYMLHGNRIDSGVGHKISQAIAQGMHWLPEHDRQIVQCWAANTYGF